MSGPNKFLMKGDHLFHPGSPGAKRPLACHANDMYLELYVAAHLHDLQNQLILRASKKALIGSRCSKTMPIQNNHFF